MGLVADHDRVGVRDPAGVAHEPLVGLDRDRPVGGVAAVEQRRADPVAVAAVAQLAVELVDEVAAMGEDQYAAGPRRLDEPERGDRLARRRWRARTRTAWPRSGPRAGLGRRPRRARSRPASPAAPRPRRRPPGRGRRPPRRPPGPGRRPPRRRPGRGRLPSLTGDCRPRPAAPIPAARRHPAAPLPLPLRCTSASSAVSVPDSASTWWADSTVAVRQVRLLLGQQPLEPEQQRKRAPPLDRRAAWRRPRPPPGQRRAPGVGPSRGTGRPRGTRPRRRSARA